jgi:hypothetical protein
MKPSALVVLGICAALAATVLVLSQFYSAKPLTIGRATPDSGLIKAVNSTEVITGTGGVPIFPGAKTVDVSDDAKSIRMGHVEYHADVPNATFEQVTAFYREWLAEAGWVVVRENPNEKKDESWTVDVIWNNKSDGPPTRRYMLLGVQIVPPGRTEEHVEVHIWHQRWPEPLKLPIISGAQQVQSTWEKHPALTDLRVTTFLVDVPPAAVEDYYKDLLPQYGWGETDLEMFLPGMAFRGRGSTLVLNTEHVSSGQTLVKFQAYGDVGEPPEDPAKTAP